jgi:hypothetical protein
MSLNASMQKKIAPVDIHRCLLNIYEDQTVGMRTSRWWVARFSNSGSDVSDSPHFGLFCTAVSS